MAVPGPVPPGDSDPGLSPAMPEPASLERTAFARRSLTTLPEWLRGAIEPHRVRAALQRSAADFRDGLSALGECSLVRVKRSHGRWSFLYDLSIAAGPQRKIVRVSAGLYAPRDAAPANLDETGTPGAGDWQVWLPELRLLVKSVAPSPPPPTWIDREIARELLERCLAGATPERRDLRIAGCSPRVARLKPGSSCTVLCDLTYAPGTLNAAWPTFVAVKTYKRGRCRTVYEGMRALWNSPLAAGDRLHVAEPCACLDDLCAIVQGPVPGARTLKDLVRSADARDTELLADALRRTAIGLAALHTCGAGASRTRTLADELAETHAEAAELEAATPELSALARSLLLRIARLDPLFPADPAVPSHLGLRPEHVLVPDGPVGFIDFDDFGMAEPAADVASFTMAACNLATSRSHRDGPVDDPEPAARAEALAAIEDHCAAFAREYGRHATLSAPRLALWEATGALQQVLRCWIKLKPSRLPSTLAILERRVRRLDALPGSISD